MLTFRHPKKSAISYQPPFLRFKSSQSFELVSAFNAVTTMSNHYWPTGPAECKYCVLFTYLTVSSQKVFISSAEDARVC